MSWPCGSSVGLTCVHSHDSIWLAAKLHWKFLKASLTWLGAVSCQLGHLQAPPCGPHPRHVSPPGSSMWPLQQDNLDFLISGFQLEKGRNYWTFPNLGLYPTQCHFCYILLVKASHGAAQMDSVSWREEWQRICGYLYFTVRPHSFYIPPPLILPTSTQYSFSAQPHYSVSGVGPRAGLAYVWISTLPPTYSVSLSKLHTFLCLNLFNHKFGR